MLGKIFANHTSVKAFIPKIYKKSKSQQQKPNNKILKRAKDLDTSPKQIYIWQTSIWKHTQHPLSLEKYKLNQQWDSTTGGSAGLKSKQQQHDNIHCWQERRATETYSLLVGMQCHHSRRQLAVSYKLNTVLSFDAVIMCLDINLEIHVYINLYIL